MKIDCISDLHGVFPKLEGGELLIVAGDVVGHSTLEAMRYFDQWMDEQDYTCKIVIAGNHDTYIEKHKPWNSKYYRYLQDSGTEFAGYKIWGSPWSAWFHGINPLCKAFTKHTDESLAKKWAMIPTDTDILITHSPPFGILDDIKLAGNVGSKSLYELVNGGKLWNLKAHVFGHIHECGGRTVSPNGIKYVNASIMNEDYDAVNDPVRIEL